jgi:hemerythrin-like domain-containing protein
MTTQVRPVPASTELPFHDAFEPLDTCHRETLRMLTEFERLVERIDVVGIDSHAQDTARVIDCYFSSDLKQHHLDEEANVFPLLADSDDPQTVQAVARLKQDHAWLRADWRVLSPLVKAVATGQSWVDVDVLRDGVTVFSTLARDHIALEESLIYPQARIRMLEASRREARLAMVARR